MKKLQLILLLSLISIFILAATIPFNKENPYKNQGIEKGKKLYLKNCSSCHFKDGTGLDAIVKDLDFSNSKFQSQTDGVIFEEISEGKEGTSMRDYGDEFSEKNIWFIVNFIRTLKK